MESIYRRIVASVAVLGLAAVAAPAVADQVTLLSVQSGHSVLLKAEGLTRVAVGDGRIAGVVPVGTSQVVVNGKAAGHTTVMVWAGGRRILYEVTVTEQALDDVAMMLRSAIKVPGVEVVTFDHSLVVRGSVSDGAQFQQIVDIVGRFTDVVKLQGGVVVNAVTISQNLGGLQKAVASMPGASDIRVDPDGKGNVIVSGNATDAVTAQAILDRTRGLAGPYLASNGQLIDRINAINNSQIDVKVYVLEVDKTAQSNLGIQLYAALPVVGQATPSLISPQFPVHRGSRGGRQSLYDLALLPANDARADAEPDDAGGPRADALEPGSRYDARARRQTFWSAARSRWSLRRASGRPTFSINPTAWS